MLPNKLILIILLIILSAFSWQIHKPQPIKWVVMKGGSLRVDGSTNINKFNCIIADYAKPDTLVIHKDQSKALPINGLIKLDVQNFDCHNPVMTSDLRKTLKAKQFPKLTIRFLSLSEYPNFNNNRTDLIKGMVAIELAGVTKRFEVDYKFISGGQDVINLIGTRQVNFSDFNIIPPRKIGGMIQTNNELSVVFNLRLKVID